MMYRMKIPLVNIRNKIDAESDGTYKKGDIDVSLLRDSNIRTNFYYPCLVIRGSGGDSRSGL